LARSDRVKCKTKKKRNRQLAQRLSLDGLRGPARARSPRAEASLARAWIVAARARQVAGHRGPAQLPVLSTLRPHIVLGRSRSPGLRLLAWSLDHRQSLWSGARKLFVLSVSFAGFNCNFDRYYSIPIAARKSTGKIVLY
jgi:hypothetical protein